MKKFLCVLISAFCLTGCLCSCSDEKESSESSSIRISTAPLDEKLLGDWYNGTAGYRFGDNRKIGLIYNFSDRGHFTADGALQTANALIPKENVSYDGKKIYATNDAYNEEVGQVLTSVLIDMDRVDGENPDTLDGEYTINGGIIVDVLTKELGISAENLLFEGIVDGETLIITIVDAFDYEIVDGKIEIFSNIIQGIPDMDYTYAIDGDTLTMTYANTEDMSGADMPAEVYTRFEH